MLLFLNEEEFSRGNSLDPERPERPEALDRVSFSVKVIDRFGHFRPSGSVSKLTALKPWAAAPGLRSNCSDTGLCVFQHEGERRRFALLAGGLRRGLPGGRAGGQRLPAPLRLLCSRRGPLHVSVPDLRPGQHPARRGTHQPRVRGALVLPLPREGCPPDSCDCGRWTTVVIMSPLK